jgi:hypothetical protein
MFKKLSFIQTVARIVLAAFLYSFVAFEPLYGITTMGNDAKADATVQATLNEQLSKLVLSAHQGRISDGCYCMKNSLNPSLNTRGKTVEVLPLLRSRGDERGVGVALIKITNFF